MCHIPLIKLKINTRKHPRSKVARRAFCVEIRKKIMWTIRISKMICTDDASSSSSSASSTLRRGFLGFWSSIHANTTLNCMFWSSSRKILKMMGPIQEKIAKKIVKKRFKKDCKKDIFFLEKSCENSIFCMFYYSWNCITRFETGPISIWAWQTDRQTDRHTDRRTSSNLRVLYTKGPSGKY